MSDVQVRIDGRVGIIELSRPEKFNCLSSAVFDAIGRALDDFERDTRVHAVLVQGQGKHFCTGADLTEVEGLRADRAPLRTFIERGHAVLTRIETGPLPVVAAVHGLCLAGGLELMLACDVVFAGASARFGDQHAQYGLIPGWGGTQRLPRVVGTRRALDLMFSARWIEASVAREWGLVNYVCGDATLHAEAAAYCHTLAERSRSGLAVMKQLARKGMDVALPQALKLEVDAAVAGLQSADVSEGLAAFKARRKPEFA